MLRNCIIIALSSPAIALWALLGIWGWDRPWLLILFLLGGAGIYGILRFLRNYYSADGVSITRICIACGIIAASLMLAYLHLGPDVVPEGNSAMVFSLPLLAVSGVGIYLLLQLEGNSNELPNGRKN